MIVDPLLENTSLYLSLLGYKGFQLEYVLDSHTHADHMSGCGALASLVGARLVMHTNAPAPNVDFHVKDGDELHLGEHKVRIIHTPGHTPDSVCLFVDGEPPSLLSADTLFIGGCGRADFAGGDAGQLYDSIHQKLFTLPPHTVVYPGHDYQKRHVTTIGKEKSSNPRLTKTRSEFIELMAKLFDVRNLPERIQEVLQLNQMGVQLPYQRDGLKTPSLADLRRQKQMSAQELTALCHSGNAPIILDIRTPEELRRDPELAFRVPGSVHVPVEGLSDFVKGVINKDPKTPVVCVCRVGVRSNTITAILKEAGLENVANLAGGVASWRDHGLSTTTP